MIIYGGRQTLGVFKRENNECISQQRKDKAA